MRLVKPVLFSLSLSLACLPVLSNSSSTISPPDGEREPGGPLGAGATLVRLIDTGARPRALVQLNLLSSSDDAEAVVTSIDEPRGRAQGRMLGRTSLVKGRPQTMLVESELETGRENHLFFRVEARGRDGRLTDAVVYLRVNLDPNLEPETVGDYLEFQGGTGPEVIP